MDMGAGGAERSTSLVRRGDGLGASLAHLFGAALGGHYVQPFTARGFGWSVRLMQCWCQRSLEMITS
jgi:hypothetical protein